MRDRTFAFLNTVEKNARGQELLSTIPHHLNFQSYTSDHSVDFVSYLFIRTVPKNGYWFFYIFSKIIRGGDRIPLSVLSGERKNRQTYPNPHKF